MRTIQSINLKNAYIVLALLLLAFTTNSARASQYVMYQPGPKAGIWASISTPASGFAGPGQSNHVSVTCCTWMQTGWRYYSSYSTPRRYWEYRDIYGNYQLTEVGDQNWLSTSHYAVDHQSGTTWCAWVNWTVVQCKGSIVGPNQRNVVAETEMHNTSSQANTTFSYVRWKDYYSGVWKYPNINGVNTSWPYLANITSGDSFYVYRYN